ncbi:hypothetical protein G205_11297 [Arthrobacter nitrophenolicus]|uniref:Uncharacterized protein n=1 Tax=Arthrobacter nitrophenolicus TaxID=683150 RepID=L8TRT7_9MICC|nr:hypothetical protein G205_11297 [Arthrobacter nitrophenolicus]
MAGPAAWLAVAAGSGAEAAGAQAGRSKAAARKAAPAKPEERRRDSPAVVVVLFICPPSPRPPKDRCGVELVPAARLEPGGLLPAAVVV